MNNNTIFLIGEDEIKSQTSLMNDIENQFIRIHILEAQNIDLQPILCEDYYEFIILQMEKYYKCLDDGNTCMLLDFLTEYDIKLIDDYIQPYLIYSVLYHSAYDLFLKITNRGVASIDNDYGRSTDDNDIAYYRVMRKDWENKKHHYMNQIIKYLNKNIDKFTIYKSCISDECIIDNTKSKSSGLYLGKNI